MREDAVQVSGVETEVDAEEGHQGHARDHCARGFLGAESAIDVEKSVERNAGVDEHPGRGHLKCEPCPKVVLLFRGGSDEGFADETAGQRHGRDRECPNDCHHRRDRHGFVQSAQFGAFAFAGAMKHGADRHPEQSLVDDMAERMGDHTGYRQWCADPDLGNPLSRGVGSADFIGVWRELRW